MVRDVEGGARPTLTFRLLGYEAHSTKIAGRALRVSIWNANWQASALYCFDKPDIYPAITADLFKRVTTKEAQHGTTGIEPYRD